MLPIDGGPLETSQLLRDPYVLVVPRGLAVRRAATAPPTLREIAG